MTCHDCPKPAAGRDGFCKGCRIKRYVKTKYHFTPELDRRLIKAYREHGLAGKIEALNDLVKITGWPRFVFRNRASKMGLRTRVYKHWTEEEIAYLRETAGERSLRTMSKRLGRPVSAISHKVLELGMSAAVTSGYLRSELCHLFGVRENVIEQWIGRGYLYFREDDKRVPHASVERFVWKHMDKYRLACCEEWWLKTMLNPAIGLVRGASARRGPRPERQADTSRGRSRSSGLK